MHPCFSTRWANTTCSRWRLRKIESQSGSGHSAAIVIRGTSVVTRHAHESDWAGARLVPGASRARSVVRRDSRCSPQWSSSWRMAGPTRHGFLPRVLLLVEKVIRIYPSARQSRVNRSRPGLSAPVSSRASSAGSETPRLFRGSSPPRLCRRARRAFTGCSPATSAAAHPPQSGHAERSEVRERQRPGEPVGYADQHVLGAQRRGRAKRESAGHVLPGFLMPFFFSAFCSTSGALAEDWNAGISGELVGTYRSECQAILRVARVRSGAVSLVMALLGCSL